MQLLINALIAGSLAALLAGGLSLVYGTLGVFNMALGQLVLFGGYTTWWLHHMAGLSLTVSIIGGIFTGALLSWITFEVCVRPFYKRHRFLPLVTTIAWSMILDGLILIFFQEAPRSIITNVIPGWDIADIHINLEQIVLILATLCLLIACAVVLHATAFGRRLRAVVQHEQAADSLGIPSSVLHRVIFIASGVLAACAGIFIGIDQNLTPVLAFPFTIKAYAAIIGGGKGNLWGAILAAYAIALLEQLAVGVHWFGLFYLPAGYQSTVALLVLIAFLLLRPQGLFGSVARSS